MFYERPILGYGPEQFKNLGIAGFDGYAHNNVAEIAINWGLVGLLVYYAMILASVLAILHGPPHKFKLLVIPVVLCLADIWFVTFLSRPFVLLLCLTLVASFPSVMKRSSGRRSMWSKRSRGRRRRSMRSEHSLGRRSTRSVDL